MIHDYVERILKARVYEVAEETPLEFAKLLSSRIGNRVLLKREDLQPVFSFKLRGAYNKISNLSAEQQERGVVAASAGNHAQGVALAGSTLGVKTHIVMPTTTPEIKVDAVRSLGGNAILVGESYDEAYAHALDLMDTQGLTLVHPFDDPDVIAGQGTIALELIRQLRECPDVVFIPVGGGGLIAGVSSFLKALYPHIKIVGVEPEDAATLHDALAAGKRVVLPEVGLFADGVAVKQIGEETFKVARETVDQVVLVKTDEICAAIKDIFEDTRTMMEPAGALSVAGMKKYVAENAIEGETFVCISSGANVGFDRLRHVAERAELGENREALLIVTLPEQPGAFYAFCCAIGNRGITEFNYRYADHRDAQVFAGVRLSGDPAERGRLVESLRGDGYEVHDVSDNTVAKIHLRYMVGGHAPEVKDELLFRFVFPERPSALRQFLASIGRRWNISLFHYRNHGNAYGRVLVGIQVPEAERGEFRASLKTLGYNFFEETENPVYKKFLS
ncbi:MAG: threonine ammonia-lyase, biosynthetic [bacterium]